MKKIIQIQSDSTDLFCLTEDGKVYERRIETLKEEKLQLAGYKKTFRRYWHEILLEEIYDKTTEIDF